MMQNVVVSRAARRALDADAAEERATKVDETGHPRSAQL